MSSIKSIIDLFPNNLQDPMLQFWGIVKDELGVKRENFTELKTVVLGLAEAQGRTEKRMEELAEAQGRTEKRMEELAVAQGRTEKRMEELAEAQGRTEQRMEELAVAQGRTEKRMEELAEAQGRTEQRVEELAEAQKQTERSLQQMKRMFDFKLGGLGARWGIDSERSFRNALTEILSDTGYEVSNFLMKDADGFVFGYPSEIEIDLIVIGEKTIVVEIKSSVSKSDVYFFLKKADYFTRETGKQVDKLLMITPFIDDNARSVAQEFQITICDSVSGLEQLRLE